MQRSTYGLALLSAATVALSACGDGGAPAGDAGSAGRIQIDGSSTVYPISQAMAEEFMLSRGRDVRVTVSQSGTGGGFQRFCAGETQISDASRPIKPEERERCEANGIEPVPFEVAIDGITLAVNAGNDFVQCLSVPELRSIWEPGSEVRLWSDVRSEWPAREIRLYGPGTDSGTFDYFTEAVMGEEDRSRQDYTASEDDNVLVQGVAGDAAALGYFGFAYYDQNRDRLKAVAVDGGDGCVAPSLESIRSGEYRPLARPMYIYVAAGALERAEVRGFLEFYLDNAADLVPQVGYVALPDGAYRDSLSRVRALGTATR